MASKKDLGKIKKQKHSTSDVDPLSIGGVKPFDPIREETVGLEVVPLEDQEAPVANPLKKIGVLPKETLGDDPSVPIPPRPSSFSSSYVLTRDCSFFSNASLVVTRLLAWGCSRGFISW
ncbi:unnamed protein product [Ilex paraguariensis]|uniref:Uncharacterized protein n=1 Tax=Ilex paraguariensis TaxID=185542 RepID=A0ABC8RI56_9AQUA